MSTPTFAMNSLDYALDCDAKDTLKEFQKEFLFPPPHVDHVNFNSNIDCSTSSSASESATVECSKCIYLCGNSLGLQPKGLNRR